MLLSVVLKWPHPDDLDWLILLYNRGPAPAEAVLSSFCYEYDAASRRTKVTREDGSHTEWGYNGAGWLTREARFDGAGVLQWEDVYEYSVTGNRTRKVHTEGQNVTATRYEYAGADNLVRESVEGWTAPTQALTTLIGTVKDDESGVASIGILGEGRAAINVSGFNFGGYIALSPGEWKAFTVEAKDKLNNETYTEVRVLRAVETRDEITITLTSLAGGTQSFHAYLDMIESVTYTCDANGNLILKSADGEDTAYEWDFENRLTRVIHPDGTESRYEYCAGCSLGLLAKKTCRDGSTVQWTWDGANFVEQAGWTSPSSDDYFVMPLGIMGNVVSVKKDGDWYYLNYDAMGTVWQITDAGGAVFKIRDYDAWGNILPSSSSFQPAASSLGFPSKPWDDELDLWYSRARWFCPMAGVFITSDPSKPGHSWPGGNTITVIDPAGSYGKGTKEGDPYLGHSDIGSGGFNYIVQDVITGMNAAHIPELHSISQNFLNVTERMAKANLCMEVAVRTCNWYIFDICGHQGQDVGSHYDKSWRLGDTNFHGAFVDVKGVFNPENQDCPYADVAGKKMKERWDAVVAWTMEWERQWKDKKCKDRCWDETMFNDAAAYFGIRKPRRDSSMAGSREVDRTLPSPIWICRGLSI